MGTEKREQDLAHMHEVVLSSVLSEEDIQCYGVDGDIQLFQEAADWLKDHRNYCLIDIGFHHSSDGSPDYEGSRLILYVEPL